MTIEYAKTVIKAEIDALESLLSILGCEFEEALDLVMEHPDSRIVACGIGKAGLIAQKVAATLASTGTASIFLHPADALHGDLGMTRKGDIALIFSNSGESDEISRLLPFMRRLGLKIIAVTNSVRSTLGVQADIVLSLGDLKEACPLGLAPTASTTAMLAMGDAFAMTLMKRRDFTTSQYAAFHPGGELGRKALLVKEVMRGPEAVAIVPPEATVHEVLEAISKARSGAAIIADSNGKLQGIFTDGDLRRGLAADKMLLSKPVMNVMTHTPHTVCEDSPASEAFCLLREHRIGELPVLDTDGKVTGIIDLKGLLAAGVS